VIIDTSVAFTVGIAWRLAASRIERSSSVFDHTHQSHKSSSDTFGDDEMRYIPDMLSRYICTWVKAKSIQR
jgi:hypothetical protein